MGAGRSGAGRRWGSREGAEPRFLGAGGSQGGVSALTQLPSRCLPLPQLTGPAGGNAARPHGPPVRLSRGLPFLLPGEGGGVGERAGGGGNSDCSERSGRQLQPRRPRLGPAAAERGPRPARAGPRRPGLCLPPPGRPRIRERPSRACVSFFRLFRSVYRVISDCK